MSLPKGTQAAHRIYYDEPGLLEFTAEVTAIREVARVNGRQVWQLALNRTAFYPTSGGQPFDTGQLTATARSGALLAVPISDVEEDDAGEVWHTTTKPLQEGTTVRGTVGAERRHDHMQQHTGQHLLSAVLRRRFGAVTVSFHLGAEQSTIDVSGGDSLTDDALRDAEQEANGVIGSALPVLIRTVSAEDARLMLKAGELVKLPVRDGPIRLIEIPGLDLNSCGGTHVSSTAAVGPLLLRGTERVRDTLRIAFVCGTRALVAAEHDRAHLLALARSLSTSVEEVPGVVERLQAETRAAAKHRDALRKALAMAEAVPLSLAAAQSGTDAVVHTLAPQHAACDSAYARLLAVALVAQPSVRIALVSALEEDRAAMALAATPGALDCGWLLRQSLAALGGRGGGTRELAQGSLPATHLQELVHTLGTHRTNDTVTDEVR